MENLGKKAKDKITGYEGIITAKVSYLYGCDQYGINPGVDKDGKLKDIIYFDIGRIEITGEGVKPEEVKDKKPGCEYNEHP